jgi:hypothetical protein
VTHPSNESGWAIDQAKRRKHRASGPRQQRLHLQAPRLAVQTPFAEVLAIVCQQTIAVFAHTGSSPADDLPNIEVGCSAGSYPDALATCETSQRNFFHRPSAQTLRESRIVNNLAIAYIYSVMQISAAGRDKMRTQRGRLVTSQEPVRCV